jgi:methionyl-tRNA formyltransferase
MVSAPLRIIYFGTPEFAIPSLRRLIASRHHVVSVVSQPDRPRGRGHHLAPTPTKALAQEHGIPVLQPEKVRDEAFLESIRALRPDLGVVAAYGRLLPESLLQIPRLGMINVHASLLPRWRGAAPVHRAVIAGDTDTGVTIMRVVKELDAGPIFASLRRPIGPEETSPEVERALAELGAALLVDVVDRMADGRATEMPQDERRVTLAPKITRDEGMLDWNLPAVRIHNLVRGLQPWPLVSSRISGGRTLLHRTAVLEERTTASAGTVVRAEGDRLDVATGGGGVLRLVAVQPEGRRVMSAREFLAGHRIAPGLTLDS